MVKEGFSFDDPKCNGCRSCELGCSFHFHKYFNPEESAIRIYRDDKYGTVEFEVGSSCDYCANEPQGPQCVYYCAPEAVTVTLP